MPDTPTSLPQRMTIRDLLAIVAPGILVAATGVGAGDLATASFSGNKLGLAVLWAVLLGAFLKYVLSEGLTRWQLASGTTLMEGCTQHIGLPFKIIFPLYLFPWSFFVGAALISACGVTVHAMIPIFAKASTGKIIFGIAQSLLGVVLIRLGGYRLFEKIMSVCIAVMFVTVCITAVLIRPDWGAVLHGAVIPTIPQMDTGGLAWTIALMGGVGGTLTIICYGYWIREKGRTSPADLKTCRIDLGVGYVATAIFGLAMVIIGARANVAGKGAGLVVALADELGQSLGPAGRWAFLLGAWGAVFSSLLGVWQAVPYVFADFYSMCAGDSPEQHKQRVGTTSRHYRWYMYGLAIIPMVSLKFGFRDIQKYYAVIGAGFMPFMACTLLYLNGRKKLVGEKWRNRIPTVIALVATLVFFTVAGWLQVRKKFKRPAPPPKHLVCVPVTPARAQASDQHSAK
ncbi:MAG: Nramp family divalent metal transporter [Lentisphaerae bacterium]|jgi:Mn2+/Fe2+ NRAMP family transporter|nr:Nramp family divalent metal transporter [Lentisphaerota bacterium]MBT4820507.1 Nramp family divalent metal transporter [Lentisphaerota bacterium]MBT5608015.1 Nramp family divalent metal transporter [Lentisphaerota bacterium]MBT7060661.1 Nramp family divalent metal transporter [Lentisphaerota bacterium]MBT7844091.1 Nramp family divalent metal transporter [Lentisphaerota bacterium]